MKRFGNFWEKIISMDNLRLAHKKARQDKEFYKEVKMVDSNPDYYLKQIQDSLINDTYEIKPSDYDVSNIRDGRKERELRKLPYYPHRIIQWAIMIQIQPIFLKVFCDHTCASIPGRGGHYAGTLMFKYLKHRTETAYCLKIDVKKFYPNVDHTILQNQLRGVFKDQRLLALLDKIILSNPGQIGLPIGSYVSQFLANFYLNDFDHWLKEVKHRKYVVRYMDDIVILGESSTELHQLFNEIKDYLQNTLHLTINPNWQVFPVQSRGIDFVGYRFFHGFCLLRQSTKKQFIKRCLAILDKVNKHQLINKREFYSLNSYIGWLRPCDSFNLKVKYIFPIIIALIDYYRYAIMPNAKAKSPDQYVKNLIVNLIGE